MGIKNWKLYLESGDNTIDFIRDAFADLEDEYGVLMFDKGNGMYNIYINTEFNVDPPDDFNGTKGLKYHQETLDKLVKFDTFVEEAMSRLGEVEWKLMFGTSYKFCWDNIEDDLNDFCFLGENLAFIQIKIK